LKTIINAKTLRSRLAEVIGRVQKGERFTVLYRSRPVCQVVPLASHVYEMEQLEEDCLYQAPAVGRSADGRSAADHDEMLYGKKR
jgi:antitoxin (DNA-binding transcriptional repressor) of toxin-antitoxin stability system